MAQSIVSRPQWGQLTMRERGILLTRVVTCLGIPVVASSGHDKSRGVSHYPRSKGPTQASKQIAKKQLSKVEQDLEDVRRRIRLEKHRIHGELPHGNPLLTEYKDILDRIRASKSR